MVQVKKTEIKTRESGVCPHSMRKCDRSRLCQMSAPEACQRLIMRTTCGCSSCKANYLCETRFLCFRDTGKGVRI